MECSLNIFKDFIYNFNCVQKIFLVQNSTENVKSSEFN